MSARPGAPSSRRLRGPWAFAPYAALDFETTGLDLERDRVVSFGLVPVDRGRVVFGRRRYLEVSPDVDMGHRSIVVHGIRPVDVADAPPLSEASEELREALDERVILAWAAHVEAAFLSQAFGGRPRAWLRRCIDVRQLAMVVDRLEGTPATPGSYSLTRAASRFGIPVERPHHALDDALTTAQLFLVFAHRLAARGHATPRRLLRDGRSAPMSRAQG